MWEQRLILLSEDPDQDRAALKLFVRDGWTVAVIVSYRDGLRQAFLFRWVDEGVRFAPSDHDYAA